MSLALVNRGKGHFEGAPQFIDNVENMRASASLINLVKGAGDALERKYPGWLWQLRPDEGGGIIDIFSLRISGRMAYTVHIPKVQDDPNHRRIIRAGGEILERFGFRRVPYSYVEWRRREQALGQFIPEVSDLPRGMQRAINTAQLRRALQTGHAKLCTNPCIGAALAAVNRQ